MNQVPQGAVPPGSVPSVPAVGAPAFDAAERLLKMIRTPKMKIVNNADGREQMTRVLTDAQEMAREIVRLDAALDAFAKTLYGVPPVKRKIGKPQNN